MYLLALHEDSNANVTLFKDNELIFSVAEERLSRTKHQAGFPIRSLAYIRDHFNLSPTDCDVIVCGNKYHPLPRILWERSPTFEHPFMGWAQKCSLVFQDSIYKHALLKWAVESFNRFQLKHKFKKKVSLVNHHVAHAYSAYMTSGFSEALVISSDNYGDGIASAVFDCRNGTCDMLYASSASNSPGQFYGEIAQLLGFHPLMAGKMTGLAAYGDPDVAYHLMTELFKLSSNKRDFVLPPLFGKTPKTSPFSDFKNYKREDIAAAAQKRFEDVVIEYVHEAMLITGHRYITLAGGIFGNVRLNQRIAELSQVEEVFIHPGMSDQGISLGTALVFLSQEKGLRPYRLDNVYWGPEYGEEEMKAALDKAGLPYTHDEHIESTVAKLLAEGKVIARFNGRLEYGPRALGNRSILYQTTDPSVNDWLNKKLNRSEFMPFAPVTLDDYAEECYIGVHKCRYSAQFMTISVHCTDWMKQISPGVIHVDGTARPQLIREQSNPSYYAIVKEYFALTGIPSLINTSFNLHGEPIVNTPHDALRSFTAAKLDYLAMGRFLVKQK